MANFFILMNNTQRIVLVCIIAVIGIGLCIYGGVHYYKSKFVVKAEEKSMLLHTFKVNVGLGVICIGLAVIYFVGYQYVNTSLNTFSNMMYQEEAE